MVDQPEHDSNNGSQPAPNDTAQQAQDDERDKRPPEFVPSRPGRMVSVRGLIERISEQFGAEYGTDMAANMAAHDESARRAMLREVAEYIFSVEAVQLALPERADIIQQTYAELFGYGPLDQFFANPQVTTIAIEGTEKIAVRYGPGAELTPLEPVFEDGYHLRRIIRRLLSQTGTEMRDDLPVIEVGLTVQERPASLSIVTQPLAIELTADIRLHPAQAITLDDYAASGILAEQTVQLLRAIATSEHGAIIVGDTESGKTTLLGALAQHIPQPERIVSVERAGELRLPTGAQQRVVRWPIADQAGVTFAQQVQNALDSGPGCILLDEVRADEPESIRPLLERDDAPRQIWSFRGAADPKRLRSALGMVARMAAPGQPEAMVAQMYRRLPFVILLRRRGGSLGIRQIAEWQYADDADYPDWVVLLEKIGDEVSLSGKRPQHPLDLPGDFWA